MRAARDEMLRFVVGPGDRVVFDAAARLPGRGIWLSASGDVLDTAARKGAFARAARRSVVVPPDLQANVASALRRRIADQIGFARRAGQAVAGFAKVRASLQSGRSGALIEASDGSESERARLLSGVAEVAIVSPLDAAALGAVFGRDHIVHAAIASGRLAALVLQDSARLAGLERTSRAPQRGTSVGKAGA